MMIKTIVRIRDRKQCFGVSGTILIETNAQIFQFVKFNGKEFITESGDIMSGVIMNAFRFEMKNALLGYIDELKGKLSDAENLLKL